MNTALTLFLGLVTAGGAVASPSMRVHVDATDIHRHRLVSTVTIEGLESGSMDLLYPRFIPGNHTTSGPIQNIAGMTISTEEGETVAWSRHPRDAYRFAIEVPEGAETIEVELLYLTNQPSRLSRSSDSYGFADFGAINWNTVVLYPMGDEGCAIPVTPTLTLPEGYAVAGSVGMGEVVPLAELIDAPTIFGEHLVSHEIPSPTDAVHTLHINGHSPEHVEAPLWVLERIERLHDEAHEVFGAFPRGEYHYLWMLDDSLSFGLEHGESTFISGDTDELRGAKSPDGLEGGMGGMTVIPHEYIHAWCGKLAAPFGLVRNDVNTPIDSSLLWVYEGLTTYYTNVLAVRSGMLSGAEFEDRIASTIRRYEEQPGRLWRSVEDTARDVAHVRVRSDRWGELRRNADYYSEASLFWLEADALIRGASGGARSLDDFCRAFFDVPVRPVGDQHTYTRADVVRTLDGVEGSIDWDGLIRTRIEAPVEELGLAYLTELLGRESVLTDAPTELQARRGDAGWVWRATGVTADDDGKVTGLRAGSPADRAGIAFEDRIMGIGERVFSEAALEEAIESGGALELLVSDGQKLRTVALEGVPPHRYHRLVPVAGETDMLRAIASPRARGSAR